MKKIILGSFVLLAVTVAGLALAKPNRQPAASSGSLPEVCRELTDVKNLPERVEEICTGVMKEVVDYEAQRAEEERVEKSDFAALAKAVEQKAAQSSHLASNWKHHAKFKTAYSPQGDFKLAGVVCWAQKSRRTMYLVCGQPLGKGKVPTNCNSDGDCRSSEVRERYFNFIVKEDGTPDERYQPVPSGGKHYDMCMGPENCPG